MAKRNLNTEPTIETPVTEVTEVAEQEPIKTEVHPVGVVSGCAKLNVRKNPAVEPNNVATTISKGDEVKIVEKKSTGDWYAVITKGNKHGYCMKKYITVQ